MTVTWARIKLAGKWALAVALLVGAAFLAFFKKRRQSVIHKDPVDAALAAYERTTAVASARYAVETTVARTKLKTEQARLLDILRDSDEDRRNDRLIEEARRLRGE